MTKQENSKPKWLQIISYWRQTKNVFKTAQKFKVTRGTVYKYIDLAKKKGK